MSVKSDGSLQKAINRFERAVGEKAFQGTIPRFESEQAEAAWDAIDDELAASRSKLEQAIERRIK